MDIQNSQGPLIFGVAALVAAFAATSYFMGESNNDRKSDEGTNSISVSTLVERNDPFISDVAATAATPIFKE